MKLRVVGPRAAARRSDAQGAPPPQPAGNPAAVRPGARAPKPRDALAAARKAGHAFVVIDGTLIPIDRVAAGGRSTPASTAATA